MSYSHKSFSGKSLVDRVDMQDIIITGSSFSQEIPDSQVFPSTMQGVVFINCNLDNCLIPEGNTVVGGSQRRFKAMEDGSDWLLDEDDLPVEKLN